MAIIHARAMHGRIDGSVYLGLRAGVSLYDMRSKIYS